MDLSEQHQRLSGDLAAARQAKLDAAKKAAGVQAKRDDLNAAVGESIQADQRASELRTKVLKDAQDFLDAPIVDAPPATDPAAPPSADPAAPAPAVS